MDYNKLMYAVENGKSLIWNDPDPIDGNDYTVQGVSDMNAESDWVTIQYGEENAPYLSEAQVLISELSFKSGDEMEAVESKPQHWIITDEDSQQAYQKVGYKKYEYKQMVFHPNYPTGKMVQRTIDLSEYSKDECLDEMAPYGYSEDDYDSWLGTENEHLIAECIFEGSLQEI